MAEIIKQATYKLLQTNSEGEGELQEITQGDWDEDDNRVTVKLCYDKNKSSL